MAFVKCIFTKTCLNNVFYNLIIKLRSMILGVVKRNPLFFHSISCKNMDFFLLHLILHLIPTKYYT